VCVWRGGGVDVLEVLKRPCDVSDPMTLKLVVSITQAARSVINYYIIIHTLA
jgi:hypothetical protein